MLLYATLFPYIHIPPIFHSFAYLCITYDENFACVIVLEK